MSGENKDGVVAKKMTAIRPIPEAAMESSDSSDSCATTTNNNDMNLSLYKPSFKYNDFVNKLDSYNNNQLLLPTQFYKTLLAKAVLSSNDDKSNVYKNMFFHKDRDFDQVVAYVPIFLQILEMLWWPLDLNLIQKCSLQLFQDNWWKW